MMSNEASTEVLPAPMALPTPVSRKVRRAHFLTLFAAGAFLVFEATQHWFYLDEWDFLAYRSVRLSQRGIFYPHAGHWTTIPILIWRGLFNVVGVRDYWLYSIPLILAHLAVAILLWRLMLRHHVDPWTATLLVAAFAVLGVGAADLTRAFQVTFVGSMAFGLLAIDALERNRLWLPALWGICALMCSNVGVFMVMTCAVVALAHRRPAAAAAAALPPTVVFLVWYEAVGHSGTQAANFGSGNLVGLASYVWTGLTASLAGFVDAPQIVGAALVILLGGVAVVRRECSRGPGSLDGGGLHLPGGRKAAVGNKPSHSLSVFLHRHRVVAAPHRTGHRRPWCASASCARSCSSCW